MFSHFFKELVKMPLRTENCKVNFAAKFLLTKTIFKFQYKQILFVKPEKGAVNLRRDFEQVREVTVEFYLFYILQVKI